MFVNSEELNQLSNHGADVVVVGAGPAGITLALELAARKKKVLLLEAGGLNPPSETENDPYKGEIAARPYPLTSSRLRYFGGTSNHWGGWVRPLDREDFEPNEDIPYSGWPIDYDELAPYYKTAHNICEVQSDQYDPNKIQELAEFNLFRFDTNADFRNAIFRFSPPTRFGDRYRQDIKQSSYIFCALNTQLLHLECSPSGRTTLVCLDSRKNRLSVGAKQLILAMGGIENARTLLYSSAIGPRDFGGDWVGRCFADHFALATSLVLARSEINYDRVTTSSGDVMAKIAPSRNMLRQAGIGNLMISLYPSKRDETLGVRYLENRTFFKESERGWHYVLRVTTGQRPNRVSRVKLSDDRDIDGRPRTILKWNIAHEDFDNAFVCINKFSRYLGATGQGRLKVEMEEVPEPSRALDVGMHHIGTTRMAPSKNYGVVNKDCKVFGTPDLYVAGSSIFPTSGYSNPTLTIVALAARLADHIGKLG